MAAALGSSLTLALLQEPDAALQVHALKKLNASVDEIWADAADLLPAVEALAEDASFPARQLAAFVAAKMYYHLESYGDAVRLALLSGPLFDIASKSQFVDTLVARCIDDYIAARAGGAGTDQRLEAVVNSMFSRCWADGEWTQALGVAVEAQRLDIVEETLRRGVAAGATSLLQHAYELVVGTSAAASAGGARAGMALGGGVVAGKAYRRSLLALLARLHSEASAGACGPQDVLSHGKVLQSLGDDAALAALLVRLTRLGAGLDGGASAGADAATTATALAMQLAFEAAEGDDQPFLAALAARLKEAAQAEPAAAESGAGATAEAGASASSGSPSARAALTRLVSIVDGTVPTSVWLDFLSHHCKTDVGLLNRLRTRTDARAGAIHNAVITAHGYAQCGTAIDSFLRSNIDWYARATHWHKFSAVASQGVVHKGHHADSRQVLASYLPEPNAPSTSPYSEAGALYALGLIHANRGLASASSTSSGAGGAAAGGAAGDAPFDYLMAQLRAASEAPLVLADEGTTPEDRETLTDVMLHGACLAVGLAGMGTAHEQAVAIMRDVVMRDSAVAGEAAGLALGMLLLGRGPGWTSELTGSVISTELLQYAHDTQHEKIIRGVAVGLALTCYGLEEAADGLIRQMADDKDPIIRYGAQVAVGLAYVGTASNAAVRRLLHVAVSDVSDDVRRAAVSSLGFVLVRSPGEVPQVVAHLAESYNPHVRYGAALALGIACAGSGMPEALALLEPLSADPVDFVRQGALVATGLLLQQETPAHLPKVEAIREKMLNLACDPVKPTAPRAPTLVRIGAIQGLGIMDAGGRNSVVSLVSRGGFLKPAAVVGVAVWLQQWYWYPLAHCLSLAMAPAAFVGITTDLKIPTSYKADVACKPSWFTYPAPLAEKTEDKAAKATAVQLSVTAKASAKAKAAAKLAAAEKALGLAPAPAPAAAEESKAEASKAMEDDETAAAPAPAEAAPATEAVPAADASTKKAKEAPEPSSYSVSNPFRVTSAQLKFVSLPSSGSRYQPVAPGALYGSGIVLLRDTTPEAAPEPGLLDIRPPASGDDEGAEPAPPAAFEWTVGDYYTA